MVKLKHLLITGTALMLQYFDKSCCSEVYIPTESSYQVLEGDSNIVPSSEPALEPSFQPVFEPSFQPTLTLTPSTCSPTTAAPSAEYPTTTPNDTPTEAPTYVFSARPSYTRKPTNLKTKIPTARPSFVSTNSTATKLTSTSTENDDPDKKRTINIIIAVVVSLSSFFALLAAYCQYKRYKNRFVRAQLSYPVHQAESGNMASYVGDSKSFYIEERKVENGQERSTWLPVGPATASTKTARKGKDTKGYSDVAMVDIYGTGGSPMGGNDNSRVISSTMSPFAPRKNHKDSARDMTTVNFFDDEEL